MCGGTCESVACVAIPKGCNGILQLDCARCFAQLLARSFLNDLNNFFINKSQKLIYFLIN